MSWIDSLMAYAPQRSAAGASIGWFGSRDHVAAEYQAIRGECAAVALGPRSEIVLHGADRAAFLHNLTTNDVKALPEGRGCEAFLLNAHGKILFCATLYAGPHAHVVDTVPGCSAALLAHLDRYRIREKVELVDRSDDRLSLLLAGPDAPRLLERATDRPAPDRWLQWQEMAVGGVAVEARRTDWTGPTELHLSIPGDGYSTVWAILVEHGAIPAGALAFEQARVERGTPWPGVDVTDDNLPQEVGRERRTISFTKGCYLGQETVARIDALGHVNRKLAGLKFVATGDPPAVASHPQLSVDSKSAGMLCSSAFSPGLGAPLALGYVRTPYLSVGTRLDSHWGAVELVALPLDTAASG